MTGFLRDLRYAARGLGRAPLLTGALFVTVAIGIGGYAAVAAFINGLFAGTVGVPDLRGIVTIEWHAGPDRSLPVPYTAFERLHARTPAFAALAAYRESRVNVSADGHSGWMTAIQASPDLWNVLRVRPFLGRMSFDPGPQNGPVGVVLAYRTWQDEFAANTAVIGTDIVVNGVHARVAAVAPATFDGLYLGRPIDLWLPLDPEGGIRTVGVVGLLAPNVSLREAQQAVTSIAGNEPGGSVLPYSGVEPDARLRLARLRRVLSIAALLVLLTAAANVAGFLLSRAGRRSYETAARVALGATRGRLASQIAAESLLVCLGGGALAVFAADWTASVMPALLYIEDAEHLVLEPHVGQIVTTVATYAVIMVICALAPLTELHRHGTMAAMRGSSQAVTSSSWLRSTLVVIQMSACVVLVVGAALLLQEFRGSLRSVQAAHIGQPIVATLEAAVHYSNETAGRAVFDRAETDVARLSGVGSVAWVATLPGGRAYDSAMQIEPPPLGWQTVAIETAAPPGRDLVALTLKAGRTFGGGDSPTSCRVALINEAAAAKYYPAGAIGRSFRDGAGRRVDIVGLVKAAQAGEQPRVYFYDRQRPGEPGRVEHVESLQLPIRPASSGSVADLDLNVASPGYFGTLGMTFHEGRNFEDGPACGVAVVNREAAQRYFGGHAVGGAVIDGDGERADIVGVVDEGSLLLMQRGSDPMVYFPTSQRYAPRMTLVAQTSAATPALLTEMTKRLLALPGLFGTPTVETLDSRLARTALGPERVSAVVVTTSAALALALSLLGVYGMMSDAVLQRKREIAIRLALGAQSWRIVAGVVRDGARIASVGAAAGLSTAWLLVMIARHLEPGTAALPLWIWAAGPIVLTVVVALASVFPSRWALAVDPLTLTRDG